MIYLVYHTLRMVLYFPYYSQYFCDFFIKRCRGAKEDVAIGMSGLVAVIHQLGICADLAVVTGDELEEAQDGALVHDAENKRRGGLK